MRISTSIGAIVAVGLLGYSKAQATGYGAPESGSNGVPVDTNGNVPSPNPNGAAGNAPIPGTVPFEVPGGIVPVPGTIPNGAPPVIPPAGSIPDVSSVIVPGNLPSNIPVTPPGSAPGFPGGAPGAPGVSVSGSLTCLTQTSTVVVTIYPTSIDSPQSGFSDGLQDGILVSTTPSGVGSDWSLTQTLVPTQPPQFSITPGSSTVSPFTTITIDIWGSPDDGTSSGIGSGSDDNGAGSTGGLPTGVNAGTNPDAGGSSTGLLSSTPLSETAPEYSNTPSGGVTTELPVGFPGSTGQNTQLPPLFPSQIPQSGYPGDVSDTSPASTGTDFGQQPNPWSSQIGPQISMGSQVPTGASPWWTVAPGDIGNGPFTISPVATATADGLFTSANGIPQGEGQTPGYTPDNTQSNNDQGFTQGISTGVSIPGPLITGIPAGSAPQGPFDSPTASGGITTCTTLTVTGADGLPTIFDSSWVIPAGTPISQASSQSPEAGITQGTAHSDTTIVPGFDSSSPVITTCTSYTITGTDGLPTIVHSTSVIQAPTSIGGFPGIPGSIQTWSSIPGAPGNFPASDLGGLISGIPGGLPTGSPSGEVGGVPGGLPTGTLNNGLSGIPSSIPTGSGNQNQGLPITTCTSYTITGTDGLPTVVESTWVVPGPVSTIVPIPGSPGFSSGVSSVLATGIPPVITGQPGGVPGWPSSAGPNVHDGTGITTCASYTTTGTDGLPTVLDSTWVIPGPVDTHALPSTSPDLTSGLPPSVSDPITGPMTTPYAGDTGTAGGTVTQTRIGSDGLPTIIDSTWALPTGTGTPTETGFNVPPGLPQVTSTADVAAGQLTVVSTGMIIGPDGQFTPFVQTVIVATASDDGIVTGIPQGTVSGIPTPPPLGPVTPSSDIGSILTGLPSLNEYSDVLASPIISGATDGTEAPFIPGTTTGTITSTIIRTINPTAQPVPSDGTAGSNPFNPPENPVSISGQAYGPAPTTTTLWPQMASLQTSTWTNLIPAPSTTYTFRFPLTTMATVAVPDGLAAGKRVVRRQTSFDPTFLVWKNSSSSTSVIDMPTISLDSSVTSDVIATSTVESAASSPTMCATGGRIGNMTIDFDSAKAGPLFNPVEDIWFSEGFHIAPPSSRSIQPFVPSSGGQLVEFVPVSMSNTTASSVDIAEIGMGPHASNPCFRFNLFGANLGCETKGDEKLCEFEISAYRYNDSLPGEESIAWKETKQIPACPTFLEGGYALTSIQLDGYTDLSSVLITARVGLEIRPWWGDNFRVGWTDNSCVAAACRAMAPAVRVKRETVELALRRGIWQWTPNGPKRFDDEVVWNSMN